MKKNKLKEDLKNFLYDNKILIGIAIFFLLITFGAFTFFYTFGVDSEYAIFVEKSATYRWIAQGRFGIGILKKILNTNQIFPFRNTILSIICIFFNCVILCKVFKDLIKDRNTKLANIIFVILYITLPISAHYMYFTTYNFEVTFAMLLASISIYLFNNLVLLNKCLFSRKVDMLLAIFLLTGVISFYQAMISVYISLVIISLILYLRNNECTFNKLLKHILKYIVYLGVSLILYYLADKILSLLVIKESYTSGFFGWKNEELKVVIRKIVEYFKEIYLTNGVYGCFIIKTTLILSIILCIYIILKKPKNKFVTVLLIISLNFVPMLLTICLGTCMPYRTQQVFLIIIPSVWYLTVMELKNIKIKYIVGLIVVLIGFRQSMYINKLFYSNYLRYQYDINVSNQIADRILELEIPNKNDYPIVYLGKIESPDIPNLIKQEVIGYSIYEWDNGNYVRIQALMTMSGEKNKLVYYLEKDEKTLNKAKELAIDMPVWPNVGSVALKDDMIIVKLSND